MYVLYIITGILLLISLVKDIRKTGKALKIACTRFLKLLPAFLIMLIFVSLLLYLLPEKAISSLLDNDNKIISVAAAALLGSVSLIPGFIAFPLCGFLLKKGISFMVLSAFTTTLMMVGVITFPIEKEYFGTRVTVIRNTLSLFTALTAALATGLFFGEIL